MAIRAHTFRPVLRPVQIDHCDLKGLERNKTKERERKKERRKLKELGKTKVTEMGMMTVKEKSS